MPKLSEKEFASIERQLGPDATKEQVFAAADKAAKNPGLLKQGWEWLNKPLVEIPDMEVEEDDTTLTRGAKKVGNFVGDVAEGFTSPMGIATAATGVGGAVAGAKGLLGAAKAARGAEAAFNAPYVLEGIKNLLTGQSGAEKTTGAIEAALGGWGVKSALTRKFPLKEVAGAHMSPPPLDAPVPSPSASTSNIDSGISTATAAPSPYSQIRQLHESNGGSTFNLSQNKSLAGEQFYALSPYKDRELVLDQMPTEDDIAAYIAKNKDLLDTPEHSFGSWFNSDNGKHYLDVSITEPDLAKAQNLARQHNQLAVFDLKEFKEIPTEAATPSVAQPPSVATPPALKEGTSGSVVSSAAVSSLNKPTTALAIGAPAASASIDDSDPNDPNQTLKRYGKLALNLLGAAGAGAAGMAAIRANPLTATKQHAVEVAGQMLAGVSKKDIHARLAAAGVPKDNVSKLTEAAGKVLDKELKRVGVQLSSTKQLLKHFHTGKGEMEWYDQTFKELQDMFGEDAEMMTKFLSATSSNATVAANVSLALKAFKQWKAGEEFKGYLPAVIMQLNRAKAGQRLEGRKIDNFVRAVTGDPDAVVVDRWMMRAFGFVKDVPTPNQYDLIENTVKELAKAQGVTPRQMQAAMWFSTKNAAEAQSKRPASPPFEKLLRQKMAPKAQPSLLENAMPVA